MIIRQAKPIDAEQLVELIKHVENTSEFMLFGAGERQISAVQLKKRIESFGECGSTIFIAEDTKELTGYLMVNAGGANKNKHSAYLVIGISESSRGQGVGKALFVALDGWARETGLHRLDLTVMQSNTAAIALYHKNGFTIEGVKKDSLFVNGEFVDEYYMAKLL